MNTTTWYGGGLRWIASLLHDAADFVERPALEPAPDYLPAEDFLSDVQMRIRSRYY